MMAMMNGMEGRVPACLFYMHVINKELLSPERGRFHIQRASLLCNWQITLLLF